MGPTVTCSWVSIFAQLNNLVVVCGSVLQRGNSGDGCVNMSVVGDICLL